MATETRHAAAAVPLAGHRAALRRAHGHLGLAVGIVLTVGGLAGGALRAQEAGGGGTRDLFEWLRTASVENLPEELAARIDGIPPESRQTTWERLAASLAQPPLSQLDMEARNRLVPLLSARLEKTGEQFHHWFLTKSVDIAMKANAISMALSLLEHSEMRWPEPWHWNSATDLQRASFRRLWHVDCLMLEERLAAAEKRLSATARPDISLLEQLSRLRQWAELHQSLGRLDLAAQSFADAMSLLSKCSESEQSSLLRVRTQLLHVRADMLLAADDAEGIIPLLDELRALPKIKDRESEYAARMQTLEALTLSLQGELDPLRNKEVRSSLVAAIERQPDERLRTQLRIHLALDFLNCDEVAQAGPALERLASQSLPPRQRWMADALTSAVDRRRGCDRDRLLEHEQVLRKDLREMIEEWKSVQLSEDGTGFLRLGRRMTTFKELLELTLTLHGPEAALQHVIEVHQCTSLSRAREATPIDQAALRLELFPPGHGAIVYLPAWHRSLALVVDRDGVMVEELPRASVLRSLSAGLRLELDSLTNDPEDQDQLAALRMSSRSAANVLLRGNIGLALQRWEHITIYGATLLGGLPFEALELPDEQLLGERIAISNGESLPLQAELKRDSVKIVSGRTPAVRCMATLTPGPGFLQTCSVQSGGSLHPAWSELVDALPEDSLTASGPEATDTAFVESSSREWDFSLLLAHGRPGSRDHLPALGMSPSAQDVDGTLPTSVIKDHPQRGIVALAACYASRGPMRIGDDGVTGTLAGAFLHSGAQAAIASEAPLRLSIHMAIGHQLARRLLAGDRAAEALRRARREVNGENRAIAYQTSQIRLHGYGDSPICAGPTALDSSWSRYRHALAIGAISAAAVALALGIRRRRGPSSAKADPRSWEPGRYRPRQ